MLDTDTVSFALRGVGQVGARLLERAPSEVCISAITLAELRYGADHRQSKKLHGVPIRTASVDSGTFVPKSLRGAIRSQEPPPEASVCPSPARTRGRSAQDQARAAEPPRLARGPLPGPSTPAGFDGDGQTPLRVRDDSTQINRVGTHGLIDTFTAQVVVMPFNETAATAFGKTASALTRAGPLIGELDTMIAAHALSLDLTLVTNNEKHFRRVAGLRIENWS